MFLNWNLKFSDQYYRFDRGEIGTTFGLGSFREPNAISCSFQTTILWHSFTHWPSLWCSRKKKWHFLLRCGDGIGQSKNKYDFLHLCALSFMGFFPQLKGIVTLVTVRWLVLLLTEHACLMDAYLGPGVVVPLLCGTGSKLAWGLDGIEVQPSWPGDTWSSLLVFSIKLTLVKETQNIRACFRQDNSKVPNQIVWLYIKKINNRN